MEFISTIDRRHNAAGNANKYDDDGGAVRRRRRSHNIDCSVPPIASSSSDDTDSHNSSEDEIEIRALIGQSRSHLENTEALKIRQHLLRPEDYVRYNTNLLNALIRSEVELSLKIDHRCILTTTAAPLPSNMFVTKHDHTTTVTNFSYRSACKLSTVLLAVAIGFVAFGLCCLFSVWFGNCVICFFFCFSLFIFFCVRRTELNWITYFFWMRAWCFSVCLILYNFFDNESTLLIYYSAVFF